MADTDLLTLTEAKHALSIGSTDVDKDTELARIITSATDLIDRHFGASVARPITQSSRPSAGCAMLPLDVWPASAIGSVHVDGTLVDPSGYRISDDGRHLVRTRVLDGYGVWGREVLVVYTAGRGAADSAAVDAHYKAGAVIQLLHMWKPYQDSTGEVTDFEIAAVALVNTGLARGLPQHFELEDPGIA